MPVPLSSIVRAAAFLAVLGAGSTASDDSALAHASKTKTEPADGATVETLAEAVLHFSEPVRLTAVSLTDAAGAEMALPTSRSLTPEAEKRLPMPELPPGRYRLEWRALSGDGHPIGGGFDFTVAD